MPTAIIDVRNSEQRRYSICDIILVGHKPGKQMIYVVGMQVCFAISLPNLWREWALFAFVAAVRFYDNPALPSHQSAAVVKVAGRPCSKMKECQVREIKGHELLNISFLCILGYLLECFFSHNLRYKCSYTKYVLRYVSQLLLALQGKHRFLSTQGYLDNHSKDLTTAVPSRFLLEKPPSLHSGKVYGLLLANAWEPPSPPSSLSSA